MGRPQPARLIFAACTEHKAAFTVLIAGTLFAAVRVAAGLAGYRFPAWTGWISLALWLNAIALTVAMLARVIHAGRR